MIAQNKGQVTPSEIATAADRWVNEHPARRGGNARDSRRDFISRATDCLSFTGRLAVSAVAPPPHSVALAQFEDYMWRESAGPRSRSATVSDRRTTCCAGVDAADVF